MSSHVTLQDLRSALESRDPDLVEQFVQLVSPVDYSDQKFGHLEPPTDEPQREGVYDFATFVRETDTNKFRRKSRDEQAQLRMAKLASLESDDAEVPLPDKLTSHELLMELWESDDAFHRRALIAIIRETPMVYGPFKALKAIFKQAEAADDTEVYGLLAARFDMAFASRNHGVSQRTLGYLVRRAWRYLRHVGQALPAIYPDVAVDFLSGYTHCFTTTTWILNHIFLHHTGKYDAKKFNFGWNAPSDWLKDRAFADAWKRSPRPLFDLLEVSRNNEITHYAVTALKKDFRAALRDVDADWVARLIGKADGFAVWILDNVPKFEQSKFRELGLHEPVLQLFYSEDSAARSYAASYARTHARDLPIGELINLFAHRDKKIYSLAADLVLERDPREDVGLDAWGEILETRNGNKIAATALRKHFGESELTPEWFADRLVSENQFAWEFASQRVTELYSPKKLGSAYFVGLLQRCAVAPRGTNGDVVGYAFKHLESLDPNEIEQLSLRALLLDEVYLYWLNQWVENGKLSPKQFGVEFLKTLAFKPDYDADEWIQEQRKKLMHLSENRPLEFSEMIANTVMGWLGDVREFTPDQLGFEWLLKLVKRSEPLYHNFAERTLTKSFLPADFAPTDGVTEAEEEVSADAPIAVDLEKQTFVFTGKLSKMTRAEAQQKVTDANGANSKSVTKKLNYLVIGDEGSPLYGEGRKGSKQVKAESLNDDGASIRIISETAFLQMLAGETREFSEDAVQAGCEQLWSMMVDAEDATEPLARFARTYLRHHHPGICLKETDRPVDPGAEVPDSFLSFEQVKPLYFDKRSVLRELALEFSRWEFTRWAPPIDGLVEMCESPYPEVRDFLTEAMTADDSPEHRRYRVDASVLTADAVYSFCESNDPGTRKLGMKLIEMHPRLRLPTELFRLTESPDRNVRAFVIRTFWSLYRDRGTSANWKPTPPPAAELKKKKAKQPIEEKIGPGSPQRPEALPADLRQLQELLRRCLFEVPPGPPEKKEKTAADKMVKVKRLPARLAKLNLIETLRDLAIEDKEFAELVLPLFEEFMPTRGKSEQAACLVAVTRIRHQWRAA